MEGTVVFKTQIGNILQKLEEWQKKWQIQLNPSNCKVLCILNKGSPPVKKYAFCELEIEEVEDITYLGITLTSELKWDQQLSIVSSKVLGMVRRNLDNCPRWVRKDLKGIQKPERVKRNAVRFCIGNSNPYKSVTEMLLELNWKTIAT